MKKLSLVCIILLSLTFPLSAQSLQGISLTDAVTGKIIHMQSELKGRGLVLIFHSLACPFAKMYESRLIALRSKYQSQGFNFILVNPEASNNATDKTALQSYIDQSDINMPYLIDENQVLTKLYKITKIPEAILLSSEGKVSYRGALDNNPQSESAASAKYLDKAMDSILKGEEPSPGQVRAVGCNVKIY